MNRPEDMGGPSPSGVPGHGQWQPTAPYPGQGYPGQAQPFQKPQPGQQPYSGQPYAGQPYAGQPYPGQSAPGQPGGPTRVYPGGPYQGGGQGAPQQPYQQPQPWNGPAPAAQQFRPGPPPARSGGLSTGKLVAIVLVGFLVLGSLGGGLFMLAAENSTPAAPTTQAAPVEPLVPAPVDPDPLAGSAGTSGTVSVTLPQTIDGRPQIDNKYAQQLMDSLRQQLAATGSDNSVVGLYGESGAASPAFLVAAATTTYDSDLLLTGLAAGMQQSAGNQQIDFIEQEPGPLGGTMRCADTQAFAVCLWGSEGVFGMNLVYDQKITEAAATTQRVRQAVEIHS